ncbi:hypothetical protein EZS27_017493 [termite gut metagenome]|uniref:DUF4293 family protein n=1 Tax=termite gut metagenome TaxID=433724 RepID=A0A5J4RM29_9ZZZZ
MIQRIQSAYLLLATGLLIAGMCLPLGYFLNENEVVTYIFKATGIRDLETGFHPTWGLAAILLLCILITFTTIFLYKRRILQIKMTIFNNILLIGYYIDIVIFYFMTKGKPETTSFQLSWALCFPAIAIILNYLAMRAIKRDEAMVKAMDRIR